MRRPMLLLLHTLLLAGTAVLGGCSDPFQREGTWHSTGVNDDNLRAMVADTRDLDRGVSEPGANGRLATAAVTRLRTGRVKPLPDSGISKIGGSGATPAAEPAPAGPGMGGG
jgi:hypothetical protein